MPELNVEQPVIRSPAQTSGVRGQRPLPWPGYPDDGRLTVREMLRGPLFGTDTPYYVTLSGFGELIPLSEGIQGVSPVLTYYPATGHAIAGGGLIEEFQVGALFPHDGLYPSDGLYPTDSGYSK